MSRLSQNISPVNLSRAALGYLAISRNKKILGGNQLELGVLGHPGLGDQITMATFYESLCDTRAKVHSFVRPGALKQLEVMFGYLDNLQFHEIPKGVSDVSFAKADSAKLGFPILVLGRRSLDYMNVVDPREGIQTQLIRSAGFEIESLHSPRLRQHLLTLPQLPTPPGQYAFFNLKSSISSIDFPEFLEPLALKERVFEDPNSPIYAHTEILLNAAQHWSIGSAFMCLSLVLGPSPAKKFYLGASKLGQDDPESQWSYVATN